ncbi:MAG: GAF domain-containing protein [Oligoflexia bacterium]|nr:GAF domain-containing protein [Oligoflexia bacterium]
MVDEERIQAELARCKAEPLVREALERLEKELPGDLLYHSPNHTVDVLHDAMLYAIEDGLKSAERELLGIAAAFHDLGFIKQRKDNEVWAAQLASSMMDAAGRFSREQIELVSRMILDTRLVATSAGLRQLRTTPLSGYLLDADLSNLGRTDFFEKGELYRRELNMAPESFLKMAFDLLNSHEWHTAAARRLRQSMKEENIKRLRKLLENQISFERHSEERNANNDRLAFLAQVPLLLNASLEPREVMAVALEEVRRRLQAEAGTIFLCEPDSRELVFWALSGDGGGKLEGLRIPADRGVVGWVITHRQAAMVADVKSDPRFFSEVDRHAGFTTRNMLCAPLMVRGSECIGAVQALNRVDGEFTADDMRFLSNFAQHIALALDNARLHQLSRKQKEKLEILDRRKNDVIQMISHEFRTPLNVIQNCADLIVSGILNDPKALQSMGDTLQSGVNRLNRLVAAVRDVSLVSGEVLPLKIERVSIQQLVQPVVSGLAEAINKRNIVFEQCGTNSNEGLQTDVALVRVVLRNLLSNAIRFTKDGGKIGLQVELSPGYCTFCVWDCGIGIPAHEQATIFEKFYEVTPAKEHSSGEFEFRSCGLGLGLATSLHILKRLGTSLQLESKEGEGSKFIFRLPL